MNFPLRKTHEKKKQFEMKSQCDAKWDREIEFTFLEILSVL